MNLNYNKIQPILELYPAIQSEGSRAGLPTIVVRVTGCTHRCYFGQGGWCDSWYTSIHAERGKYTLQNVVDLYREKPHIKEMMLTGGSPTMYPKLVNELMNFANGEGIFVTMETECSKYVETEHPIDLLSISPKFSNSIPILGTKLPKSDQLVDQKFIDKHNKFRCKADIIKKMINYHKDYQIKPVLNEKLSIYGEFLKLQKNVGFPDNKVWMMPAGGTPEALAKSSKNVLEFCLEKGYNFTYRYHIAIYGDMREV